MKKYLVEYENLCVLFGDRHDSKIVEAENEKQAIGKVACGIGYVLGHFKVTEIQPT